MAFTENSFENFSKRILSESEELSLWLLDRLRQLSNRTIQDPTVFISINDEARAAAKRHDEFLTAARQWVDEEVATAYLRGIESGTKEGLQGAAITAGAFAARGLLIPNTEPMEIAPKAAKILEEYAEHHTVYSVFQRAAYQDFNNTRIPIIREQEDRIRRIIIQASEKAYQEADVYTRRRFSQDLMRRFSDEGITGVRYMDGRTMKLDSYCEMVARTQTSHASQQATWNNLQEQGMDLVQISAHWPCSDLCEPWQGKAYSLSGESTQYPPLQDAIDGGVWHPNCAHSSSAFVPGTSVLPEKQFTAEENEEMYKSKQKQRYNEAQIRAWKRRETSAVDPVERDKAKQKIREWQAKNRSHVKEHDFLRRKYDREQI